MSDPEAVRQLMEKIDRRLRRALLRELEIESELTPLPDPSDPLYELIRAQHGIAEVRRRMRGRRF